jgi:hypothetical protein
MEVLHISLGITIYNGKNTGKSLDRWKWYGIKLLVTEIDGRPRLLDFQRQ